MRLALIFLIAASVWAQGPAELSGRVNGPSGLAVANAKISVKNKATGQTTEAQTNAAGLYTVANLPAGDYEVTVSADGFSTQTSTVMLAAGSPKTVNVLLQTGATQAPSLKDLGFSPEQTQGSAAQQALLDRRSHMLGHTSGWD